MSGHLEGLRRAHVEATIRRRAQRRAAAAGAPRLARTPSKGKTAPAPATRAGVSIGLLTAREVADLLAISTETVLRWTRRGELPAVRLPGGAVRYREPILDAWLEERTTPSRGSVTHPAQAPPTRGRVISVTHPQVEEQ